MVYFFDSRLTRSTKPQRSRTGKSGPLRGDQFPAPGTQGPRLRAASPAAVKPGAPMPTRMKSLKILHTEAALRRDPAPCARVSEPVGLSIQ